MNTEKPTKVEQLEKEVDALRLLFKRRPILCLLIVLWLIGPAIYAGYQAIQVRKVEKENSVLKEQLADTKRDRDSKAAQLAPFLATADLRFPDDPPDKRLELLLKRFEKAIIDVEDVARRMGSDRLLSERMRERTIERLKRQPSLNVDITSVLGDAEAHSLAEQLKAAFLDAGWPVSKGSVSQAIFSKPQRGCKFVFAERPSPSMQEIFLDILDSIGQKQKLFLNPQQSEGTLKVIVGSR